MRRFRPPVILATLLLLVQALPARGAVERTENPPADLPDVALILAHVTTNAAAEPRLERLFMDLYAFERTTVQVERDKHGVVKKRTEKTSFHTPPPLGAPTPASAVLSESRGFNPTNHQGRAFERRDFTLNPAILARFTFTLVGRDVLGGRDAFVLDFRPAGGKLPVHGIKDRFINKAAGRVWIDAEESTIAKAALHLTEEVDVLGGLVGAVKACSYNFERERTPEGLWFTRSVDWRLEGREVLTQKVIEHHETRTNVRKER